MASRSIKPGVRVSAITSLTRDDIVIPPQPEGSPDHISYGIAKAHAPPPLRAWVVIWEVDGKETTVPTLRLTVTNPLDRPNDPDEIIEIVVPEVRPSRRAAPRYVLDEIDSDADLSEWEEPPREARQDAKAASPPPAPLPPEWTLVDSAVRTLIDPRKSHVGIPSKTRIRWEKLSIYQLGFVDSAAIDENSRSPIDYFLMAFPVDIAWPIVQRTNAAKAWEAARMPWVTFSIRKLFKVIGFIYLMSRYDLPTRRQYFQSPPSDNENLPFPDIWPNWGQRFGMGETEFSFLLSNISWSAHSETDPWHRVRDLFEAFNKRRRDTVEPSARLTVDESMSVNTTKRTGDHNFLGGLPHQTVIPSKPVPVGCEIKTLIDCDSQIMMGLEIQEGKEVMRKKKYDDGSQGAYGPSVLLRLTEPWFDSHRTVYADSAFSSVRACRALLAKGLYLIGMVKTATVDYPMDYFKTKAKPQRGATECLERVIDGQPIVAVGWWDKCVVTMVTTCPNNLPGPVLKRNRHRLNAETGEIEVVEIERNIGATAYEYYTNAGKIDAHNHRRQGILALEQSLKTNDWSVRLISTVLGIILVDAYNMYLYENDTRIGVLSFRSFVQNVGLSLVTNRFDNGPQTTRVRSHSEAFPDCPVQATKPPSQRPEHHTLKFLRSHPCMKKEGRKTDRHALRCRICGVCTSHHCGKCSTDDRPVAICAYRPQVSDEDQCLTKHINRSASIEE